MTKHMIHGSLLESVASLMPDFARAFDEMPSMMPLVVIDPKFAALFARSTGGLGEVAIPAAPPRHSNNRRS